MRDHLSGKKNKQKLILTGFLLTLLVISDPLVAQDRLFVGFSQQESLSSLALTQDWYQKGMGQVLWPLLYDHLWMMGPAPDYKAMPGLATFWETDDHKTWRFYLSPEATFHDQIPVSVEDVLFSLTLPNRKKDGWNNSDGQIISFSAIDQHTFEVMLAEPHSGPYPPFYQLPILPRHIWKKFEQQPETHSNPKAIGSGPYRLKEFKPNEVLRLVKSNSSHRYEAAYEEIVFMVFPNVSTLHAALKSGIIDFFGSEGIDPTLMREFDSARGIKTVVTEGLELFWLSFNLSKREAIQDLRVRKAVMMGIDKSEIIRRVFAGYATEVHSFVYPELEHYNPGSANYFFDAEKAAEYLDEAGYKDLNNDGLRDVPKSMQDLTFSLLVSKSRPSHMDIAKIIRKQMRDVGIKINVMLVDDFVYNNFLHNPQESGYDMALSSGKPGPYQDGIWKVMKSEDGLFSQHNSANYVNYAVDRILAKMLSTTSLGRKSKYLFLLQEILADDLPYGVLVRPYKICPVREDRVQDLIVSMGGISSGINPWNYLIPDPGTTLRSPFRHQ